MIFFSPEKDVARLEVIVPECLALLNNVLPDASFFPTDPHHVCYAYERPVDKRS